MFARLPLKGPIFVFASVTLALGGIARLAQNSVTAWQRRSPQGAAGAGVEALLAGDDAAREQLGALAPLAGSLALADELGLDAGAATGSPAEPAAPPRVHAPFAAEPPVPRNIEFELRLADGAPLIADRVEVDQAGGDGALTLNAYRDANNPARWCAGSPGVTTGAPLSVRVRAFQGAAAWKAIGGFSAAPAHVGLELGVLQVTQE